MRFAICNEVFGPRQSLEDWRHICHFVASCGYQGIEVAPFTFAENVNDIDDAQRRVLKNIAQENNLTIVALHWLLVSPPGLHLHTRDKVLRRRTRDHLASLIDFACDLGAGIMVLGSHHQRHLEDADFAGAWQRTGEVFNSLTPILSERNVTLCPEALPPPDCDFIQRASEAAQLVEEINHPNVRLMLDAKSLSAEVQPPLQTIRELGWGIAHFHANDANRRAPGYGETDFHAIATALREVDYQNWVSVEPFDYWPDPHTLTRETLKYLRGAFAL
ncbi:MAG TPA: sugar phosphate isomerase/epimerase family protein [Abditibacteriaceae bacterium]|jgi:sugar phosphate isomerase/epimerase